MSLKRRHLQSIKKDSYLLTLLGSLLLVVFLLCSISNLTYDITLPYKAIHHYMTHTLPLSDTSIIESIYISIRLPRLLLGILCGFILSLSGCCMQTITRNYLVSPFTMGISAAAACGASLGIVFFNGDIYLCILMSLLFSLLCVGLLYVVSFAIGFTPTVLVLIGISLNYIFGASTELLKFLAKGRQVESILQWSFGTLSRADWDAVFSLWITILVAFIIFLYIRQSLSIMMYNSDEISMSLGVDITRIQTIAGISSIAIAAISICFTGVIGFIGLISPHIARLITPHNFSTQVYVSMLIGSILMLIADTIGHYILYPADIPVSVVLSFIGVPLFVHLLIQRRGGA